MKTVPAEVCQAVAATVELAVEPLGFAVGVVLPLDGSAWGRDLSVGSDLAPGIDQPVEPGETFLGEIDQLAPARAAAARAAGLSFFCAIPLGVPAVAVLALFAREAPFATHVERARRAMKGIAPLLGLAARNEDKHTALIENLEQAVGETDREGRFTSLNPAWTGLTGHPVDATLGKRFTEFVHPEDREASQSRYAALMTGQTRSVRPKVRYRFADGSYRWLEIFAHAVAGADGLPVGCIVAFMDVTERHGAIEALRSSEENLRKLLELAPEPILIHQEGIIVYVNPAWMRIQGVDDPAKLVGGSAFVNIASEDLPTVLEVERRMKTEGAAQTSIKVKFRRPGVDPIHVDAAAFPIPRAGKPPLIVVIAKNVTDDVRTGEALRQAVGDAERAARSRSEFLANISHELRTPLHGILGMTELTLGTELDEDQRGQLRTVNECATGLLGIIDDIIDFSRMEVGQVELERSAFDLWDVLGGVVRPLSATAAKKGIEVVCHVDAGVPTRLIGDGGRLRQLFFKLVANAIKFSEKGEVVVEIARAGGDGDEIELHARVIDQGVGIPEAKQRDIFDAFEQAESAFNRRYGGIGLGLAMCAQLVRAMGGRIWVESVPGQGATFHVTLRLPVEAAHLDPAPFASSALVVAKSARVRGALAAMLGSGTRQAADVDVALRSIWIDRPAEVVLEASLAGAHDVEAAAKRAGARLVLLVAPGAPRPQRMGAGSARVIKPALAPAVRMALQDKAVSSVHTVAQKTLTILLAEDNEVNQRLMSRHLEKLGHRVTPVENGRLALAAIGKQKFDLILMDVQMPELDGLTTTRIIRKRESQLGGHVPIVALTAHALDEHRDQCLAAGMDDFLIKPLPIDKLQAVLDKLTGSRNLSTVAPCPSVAAAPPPTEIPETPVIDLAKLKSMVGDDPEAIPELAGLFIDEAPRHRHMLKMAVSSGDPMTIAKAAHKARASFLAMAANDGGQLAADIEARARAGADVADLAPDVVLLEEALDAVCKALASFATPAPAASSASR